LVVDEAHGDGVLGPNGGGLTEELGLQGQVHLTMGTFGKAFGCFGAAVVGNSELIETLIQGGRPFIYSTALPGSVAAAVLCALEIAAREPNRRARLLKNSARFRELLLHEGFDLLGSTTQIIPVVVGENHAALQAAQHLREQGFWIQAVRAPTVPAGTARLRINLTAGHDEATLVRLAEALVALRAQGVPFREAQA
jgi:7-keto-8-aminopelargonate synthetase-like enzyme